MTLPMELEVMSAASAPPAVIPYASDLIEIPGFQCDGLLVA